MDWIKGDTQLSKMSNSKYTLVADGDRSLHLKIKKVTLSDHDYYTCQANAVELESYKLNVVG